MPLKIRRAIRAVTLAAVLALTSTAGWTQSAAQMLLPNQQQQTVPQQQYYSPQQQQPSDTVTRDVLGVFGTTPDRSNLGNTVARPGAATQAEGGPTVAPPIGDFERRTGREELQPFGASLFLGTSPASSDTPNPAYVIQPGDRVAVRVWGGFDADTTSAVDPEGNIFLQGVGPIRVAGTAAQDLQRVIEGSVSRVFTQRVYVYAVLITTHRVAVFVTGYVKKPGRYTGGASDTVLDYLVRAGGVDPSRGSYRDIVVVRGEQVIGSADLYRFLIAGQLPAINLREGDRIIVGKQRAMVGVDGATRNSFLFELSGNFLGRDILELARPLPSATNAIVRGTRNDVPYVRYVSLEELSRLSLSDQDQVSLITDAPARTIRVKVEGSRLGPSVLVADRNIRLPEILDYIAVDNTLADTKSVFLLRPALADQQLRAITEATDRLERELFLAISSTTGEAQIRASEANLVASYIRQARRIRPEGRLVVADDEGSLASLRLEDGDTIVIPQKSQIILVSGEVLAPQGIVFRPELRPEDYVKRAGGYSQRGSEGNFMIRRANGQIMTEAADIKLRPGDELIVMPRVTTKYFQIAADLITVLYQVALASRVICQDC